MIDREMDEFEHELEAISPRPSSPELRARIGAALAEAPPESGRAGGRFFRPVPWRVLVPLGIVAAAAMVLFILREGPSGAIRPASRPPERGLGPVPVALNGSEPGGSETPLGGADVRQPMWAVTILVTTEDEGVQVIAGKGPVRRMRYHLLDRFGWLDRSSDYAFESYRPREEVVYVRLGVQ